MRYQFSKNVTVGFDTTVNSPHESGYKITGAQEGIRTPPPDIGKRILSRSRTHPPAGDVRLVNSFVSDKRLRGLSSRTCQFYEGYLTRFVNTIDKPLLDISKNDIATVLASLDCNAVGKHAYFRVLRAFYRWACQEGLLVNSPMVNMKAPKSLLLYATPLT